MGSISKGLSLLLVVILAASSLMIVESAFAQTILKPSVPEFTLRYVDNVDNQSIKVIISDQLPAHHQVNNITAWLWYNIGWKNHTENAWHIYASDSDYLHGGYQLISATNSYISSEPVSNDSIKFNSFITNVTYVLGHSDYGLTMDNFSVGQMIDFKVKAIFGYYELVNYKLNSYTFRGNESDWSPIQTITIPASSPLQSPSPSIPELSLLMVVTLLLSVFSVAVLLCHRKTNLVKKH
jgi:hypothetical protein